MCIWDVPPPPFAFITQVIECVLVTFGFGRKCRVGRQGRRVLWSLVVYLATLNGVSGDALCVFIGVGCTVG